MTHCSMTLTQLEVSFPLIKCKSGSEEGRVLFYLERTGVQRASGESQGGGSIGAPHLSCVYHLFILSNSHNCYTSDLYGYSRMKKHIMV